SYITIPPATSRESGIADFLVEKKYGREMVETDVKVSNTNIVYDVDVTANPMVNVKVVLDDLTGDEIKGRGNGALNIRSGTSEPLSLRGRFNIEEGSYLFTFQSFFKKPFEIKKGANNYIEWVGDPYDANIRFEATYKAERVSYAPLASSLSLNTSGISNAREDVFVVATLTDKLFKPKIDFALNFLTSSVAVTDPELALLIQQMQKNENEINRQVTYLIVFNSFAPSELGGTAEASKFNPINTISGIFLNVISDRISKLLGNLLKDDKYIINLNTSIYNRNPIDQGATSLNLGSNVNFSVGRAFFNNRFIISTGVGLETPIQQQTSNLQQSIQFLPDVKLEWLINETGTVRASFFYIENTDYFATTSKNARRVGGNISFKKDFNRLSDIFKKRPKKSQPAENQEPENKEATVPENKTVPEGD
ncbi:MAG TPA: translocation/assembly module TamB domain-containing protein, partial [Chitinophagaceae bacterium]|nr:translocation/assembly module TamB domain-containing protein [Chitinophagaceae bacterium]